MQTSLIGEELVNQICFGISLGELWIRPAVYWTVGRGSFPLASKSVSFSLDWHQDKIWAESTVERTPPYCHLFITETSLLQPLFLATQTKLFIRFFVKKPSLIRPIFFGPLMTVKTGFYCMNFQPATAHYYG